MLRFQTVPMLRFQTVVAALDFSEGSEAALIRAADLAERGHADLHLLYVNPLFRAEMAPVPGGDPDAAFRTRVERYVTGVLGADDAFRVLAPTLHESRGEDPAEGILHYAREVDADLVVVGTHGRRGLGYALLGSVAAEVLRRSPVPVLVIPNQAEQTAPGPDHPVLVAVDFSEHTRPALRYAREVAAAYAAPVELIHVRDVVAEAPVDFGGLFTLADLQATEMTSQDAVRRALHRLGEDDGAAIREGHVVTGAPEVKLVRFAHERQIGTIVMGTHGRTGLSRFRLGSVSEWTARHAPCPVLTIPTSMAVASADRVEAAAADR